MTTVTKAEPQPKMTMDEKKQVFLEAVRRKGSREAGVFAAHVAHRTYGRWLAEDANFVQQLQAALEIGIEADRARRVALPAVEQREGGGSGRAGLEAGGPRREPGVTRLDTSAPRPEAKVKAKRRQRRRIPGYCKMTPENVAAAAKVLQRTGDAEEAGQVVGVHAVTIRKWMRDEESGDVWKAAKAAYERDHSLQRLLGDAWAEAEGAGAIPERMWAAAEAEPDRRDVPGLGGVSLADLRQSPERFFLEVLGWQAWGKQVQIAEAVREAIGGVTRSGKRGTASGERWEGEGPPHSSSLPPSGTPGERGFDAAPSGTPGETSPLAPLPSTDSGRCLTPPLGPPAPGEGKMRPRRVAVRSGNGVGKTAIAARIMLWVLRCWPGSVVITTAPTTRQVEELFWREARAAFHNARIPLGGRFYGGQARWELGPQRVALGFSLEATRPERFQGFHADLIVFIADEASDVSPAHWEAIKGSALAGRAVIFAIGNPTRTQGEFYDAFHSRAHLWRPLAISAYDTPNFTEGPGAMPGLVGPEGVEEARIDWGEGSPMWQVRILGQFPTAGSNALIHLDWLEEAGEAPYVDGPYALGVDVARSGEDETVLALMKGNRLLRMDTWRGQDTMKTAGRVLEYHDTHRGIAIAIDDGGVGGGVVDRLRELGVAHKAIKFGAAADGRKAANFRNKMSELHLTTD